MELWMAVALVLLLILSNTILNMLVRKMGKRLWLVGGITIVNLILIGIVIYIILTFILINATN